MARKEKKYHFIYKTTNILSGRYYIGMHSTDNLDDGYLGSGKRLRYSINKYGKENHKREIIEFCDSRAELKVREVEVVNLNEIAKVDCMNLVVGGQGGFTVEIQRMGGKATHKAIKKLKETNPEWVEKRRKNISDALKRGYANGKRDLKFNYDWNGVTHTKETKQKISNTKKGTGTGENNSQFGTCWITKDVENKKVKKEDLDQYIKDGWKIGRKY